MLEELAGIRALGQAGGNKGGAFGVGLQPDLVPLPVDVIGEDLVTGACC